MNHPVTQNTDTKPTDEPTTAAEPTEVDARSATSSGETSEDAKDRKERVLHTRVPGVLEDELKRLAGALRVPVSNVVRAILEDAVDAADLVTRRTEGELRGWTERLAGERQRLRERVTPARARRDVATPARDGSDAREAAAGEGKTPLDGVIGFQALLLATASSCAVCARALPAGEEAFLGIRDGAGPRVILGRECLPGRAPAT
jgi:hypothetical protein